MWITISSLLTTIITSTCISMCLSSKLLIGKAHLSGWVFMQLLCTNSESMKSPVAPESGFKIPQVIYPFYLYIFKNQQSCIDGCWNQVTTPTDRWWPLKDPEPRKTVHTVFFELYKFLKGQDQASINYIQHVYRYSTLSNCPKVQHHQGNEIVNIIDDHYIILQGMMQC